MEVGMPVKNETECIRCGGTLEQGYSVDSTFAMLLPQIWIPGKPKPGMAGTIKVASIHVRRGFVLQAWRCSTCTHVELFAREKTAR